MQLRTISARCAALLALVATVLFVASPAPAAELATELDQLATAINARLGAAGGGKEAKSLVKARDKIVDAQRSADPGAKTLEKILSAVFGSKTVDATVLAEAQDVLDCLRALAEASKSDASSYLADLGGKFADQLGKKIASGDRNVTTALGRVASDPKKAAKGFRKAVEKYLAAEAYGAKSLAKQNAQGSCGKIPKKIRMTARLTGDGVVKSFKKFAGTELNFGILFVSGCDAQGPDKVCRTLLNFSFAYDSSNTRTGEFASLSAEYVESSNFGNGSGPGVQDVRWSGTLRIEVTKSSEKRILGCFHGTLNAVSGQQPGTLQVEGTFSVKRPRGNGF